MIFWGNLYFFDIFGWRGGSAPPPQALCDGSTSKGETFFRKTTFFFRSRDPFKKHGAEILCRTALVSRKIDLRRPHSWPKEFLHFCPNLGSGDEHLKWARPQTNCAQEKINAWAYPQCRSSAVGTLNMIWDHMAHAFFFPVRNWSGVWLISNVRCLTLNCDKKAKLFWPGMGSP